MVDEAAALLKYCSTNHSTLAEQLERAEEQLKRAELTSLKLTEDISQMSAKYLHMVEQARRAELAEAKLTEDLNKVSAKCLHVNQVWTGADVIVDPLWSSLRAGNK